MNNNINFSYDFDSHKKTIVLKNKKFTFFIKYSKIIAQLNYFFVDICIRIFPNTNFGLQSF